MKNGTRNEKVVFDIIFNLICMIYIIYSWMSITNVGVVTALTHNNGDAMLLIFGAAIVLIVFFIIDIISLILGKRQKGYLLPGYVGVSIGVKCIAILCYHIQYLFFCLLFCFIFKHLFPISNLFIPMISKVLFHCPKVHSAYPSHALYPYTANNHQTYMLLTHPFWQLFPMVLFQIPSYHLL